MTSARAIPLLLNPRIEAADDALAYWLRQVTVRLRREVSWCWANRAGQVAQGLPPMIDAAAELTNGQARGADMKALVDIGRWMAGHEVILLPGAREAVTQLAERHRLMLITKGELMDQERKIQGSGLAEYFRHIEIVSDKTVPTYTRLLERHGIAPQHFLMVGNALRSDILPVLEMGGYAVYVPYDILWAHESNVQLPQANGRYHEIASLGELPVLIEQIDRE